MFDSVDAAQEAIRRRWMSTIPKQLRPRATQYRPAAAVAQENPNPLKVAADKRFADIGAEVFRARAEGQTYDQIAAAYGLDRSAIRRMVRRAQDEGMGHIPSVVEDARAKRAALAEEAIRLRGLGLSWDSVAARLGSSSRTVARAVEEAKGCST